MYSASSTILIISRSLASLGLILENSGEHRGETRAVVGKQRVQRIIR